MGRHSLRLTVILGLLITALGSTGIFAVFSDRATAGEDSVTSGARPRAADLRIAPPDVLGRASGFVSCGDFQDNTTTPQFTVTNVQPGQDLLPGNPSGSWVCLTNVGSAPLTLTASVIDLADLDVDCTGDEATLDETCGENAGVPQAGELSPLLLVEMERVNCADGVTSSEAAGAALTTFSNIPFTTVQLAPSEVACVRIQMSYPTPSDESVAQAAQSDRVTWRFAFDGTAD